MSDTKLPDLNATSSLASADECYVVDKSDTTDGSDGTSKKFTITTLVTYLTTALQSTTQTLTNKTIDITANTIQNLFASIAQTDTGTSTALAVTPDALAGSDFGIKYVTLIPYDFSDSLETGDGKDYFHIPAGLDGFNLVEVHAEVITAGTTNTTDIQIYNVTQTADMLSTKLTIDSTETGSDTAATAAVIDTDNDDISENDVIRLDIDQVSTTAPKGLIVTLGFRKP